MAHTSPAVNLVWAFLATMLGSFLLFHIWSFDRFRCLRWNHGPYSGSFKRVMTYSYLLSVPLIMVYSVGFAIIKYTYGFAVVPGVGIVPMPYELWSPSAQNAILPLYLSVSIAWGLEMLTHLEELCFWLFVVNSVSAQQDWFKTLYFKIWAVGSCLAVLFMPMITIFTREDVYKCEAYTFLAGGLASLSLTIWFLPVLWAFPSFLANLKELNIDSNTLIRLIKFHELNCIRVVFRFMFTIPLVILGADGVRPHHHINDKMLPTDFLAIMAGIGCVVSSGITLVIFFPRSIEGEMAVKEQQRSRRQCQSDNRDDNNSCNNRHQLRSESRFSRWSSKVQSMTLSSVPPRLLPSATSDDSTSYISIKHSKTELDKFDAAESLAGMQARFDACSVPALPAYESVAGRGGGGGGGGGGCGGNGNGNGTGITNQNVNTNPGTNGHGNGDGNAHALSQERVPSARATAGDADRLGGSISLKPNRLNVSGDVELGAVLTVSEVDLVRAQSRRDRGVSSVVHHWRSPIEIGRPTATTRWQRRI